MKKNELKKILNESFNNETPDFLQKIKAECQNIQQIEPTPVQEKTTKPFNYYSLLKKLSYSLVACALFFIGILIGNIEPTVPVAAKAASIYLDVNPSIEIVIDEDNKIIKCSAINEDGSNILVDLDLDGVDIDTGLFAIVGLMYTNGYLNTTNNSILVSVDTHIENTNKLLTNISETIDQVFKDNIEMECSLIVQKVDVDDELKNTAEENNISIGKMQLIEKIIEKGELYTKENIKELSQMIIHELDLLYHTIIDDNKEPKDDEIISGSPNGYLNKEEVLNIVMEDAEISMEEIKYYDIFTIYDFQLNMVYSINIILENKQILKYKVNCETGEIQSDSSFDGFKDWDDKIDDFVSDIFDDINDIFTPDKK